MGFACQAIQTVGISPADPNPWQVTDDAVKPRRSISNALGQLKRVDEPNNLNQLDAIDFPNPATVYGQDLFDNLTTLMRAVLTRTLLMPVFPY